MGVIDRSLERRVVEGLLRGRGVVIVSRSGKPGRVFDLDVYLKRIKQTRQSRPWEHRRAKAPNPLGTIKGRVLSAIRRQDIYP